MHEFSICRSLIDQVEAVAREHSATTIKAIVVGLGPLCGIQADELRQAFPLASAGTLAGDARLHIRLHPLRWRCLDCGEASETMTPTDRCARCHSDNLQLLGGDQIFLEHVEVTT